MKNRVYLKIILITALLFGLSSCGVWYNFKAYFNSYYNAKVLFDQAEGNISNLQVDLFSFLEPTIQAQDYLTLTKVNEKCSKILQFDTHSGYFIDALWLSGKAFYYQKEYVKAERKFKELLTIEQDSVKLIEVNLWLGKTKLQMRNFDEGIKLLDQVAESAIKYKEDELFTQAVIKQIAYLIYKERYPEAIEKCSQFVKNSQDDEKKAEVAFELGKFYYKNNDYEKASDAFKSVSNFSPTFETGFRSKLEYAKCLMDMNKLDEGMSLLNDLKNKSQYSQYLDEVSIELGTGYYFKKDYEKAMDVFTKVDTLYYGSKSSGIAEYMKAQIYEYHLPNFDSAFVYYDYANKNGLLSNEMRNQIAKKTNIFTSYINKRDEIFKEQKQILYSMDKSQFLRDSLIYVEAVYRDTLGQKLRMQQTGPGGFNKALNPNQLVQNQTGQTQTTGGITGQIRDNEIPAQVPQTAMGSQSNQDMTNQQNLTNQQAQQKLGLSGQSGTSYRRNNNIRTVRKKPLPPKPVLALIPTDSLKSNMSSTLFGFANSFFNDMDLPDSAEYYYKKILSDNPKKSILSETYYALATVYSTTDRKEKADSLFRIVYENYKNTPLALSSAKKLGLIEEDSKIDPAENFYVEAEKKYYNNKYSEAISDFRSIIKQYPKSKFSPRSAYYIAFIFENDIKDIDSTTASYEYLSKTFPGSDIANKVKKRQSVYQEEKNKREREKGIVKPPVQSANPSVVNTVVNNIPKTAQDSSKGKPAGQKNVQLLNQPNTKLPMKDSVNVLPDSIKAMMQKAQMKDALKEKQKKTADSLNAERKKLI